MTTTSTRRPATAADLTVGAIVFKGSGKVAYRIWAVREDANYPTCSVVKATTATDPTRGTWWGLHELTVEG